MSARTTSHTPHRPQKPRNAQKARSGRTDQPVDTRQRRRAEGPQKPAKPAQKSRSAARRPSDASEVKDLRGTSAGFCGRADQDVESAGQDARSESCAVSAVSASGPPRITEGRAYQEQEDTTITAFERVAHATPVLYRVADAMQVLSMSRSVIYDEMRAGRLRTVKRGRTRLVPATAIYDYVALLEREAGEAA